MFRHCNRLCNTAPWQAMQKWNKAYKDYLDRYIENQWGRGVLNNFHFSFGAWPLTEFFRNDRLFKLFVFSCDGSKYNLIFPTIGPTPPNALAYHRPFDPFWSDFYGEIVMSDRSDWKDEELFVNVKMHELGHALGLPHLPGHESNIMTSSGFGCAGNGEHEICDLTDHDFKDFLKPYKKTWGYGGGMCGSPRPRGTICP